MNSNDFRPTVRFLSEELLRDRHLIISEHTRRFWETELSLERAHREIEMLLESYQRAPLAKETERELTHRMEHEARRYGLTGLPTRS